MLYLSIDLKNWYHAGVCWVKQTNAKMLMVELWLLLHWGTWSLAIIPLSLSASIISNLCGAQWEAKQKVKLCFKSEGANKSKCRADCGGLCGAEDWQNAFQTSEYNTKLNL